MDPAAIASAMGVKSSTVNSLDGLKKAITEPVKGISVVVVNVPSRETNADSLKAIYESMKSI